MCSAICIQKAYALATKIRHGFEIGDVFIRDAQSPLWRARNLHDADRIKAFLFKQQCVVIGSAQHIGAALRQGRQGCGLAGLIDKLNRQTFGFEKPQLLGKQQGQMGQGCTVV